MANTETVYSKEADEDMQALRAALKNAETQAAAEVAKDGKASDDANRRVAAILKQIGDITGEVPGKGIN